jgi:glutamate dehydrogenase
MAKKSLRRGDRRAQAAARDHHHARSSTTSINRTGPSFVHRLQDATGRSVGDVVRAFAVVRDGFALPALYREIDALDNRIDGPFQVDLYLAVGRLIQSASAWLLKNDHSDHPVGIRIEELRSALSTLAPAMGSLLPAFARAREDERRQNLVASGAPEGLAKRLAALDSLQLVPDIALAAVSAGAPLMETAAAYFAVSEAFRIARIEDAARMVSPTDYYDGLALTRAMDQVGAARRAMTVAALAGGGTGEAAVARWLQEGGERFAKTRERLQALTEGGEITVSRLSVAAGLMIDLTA